MSLKTPKRIFPGSCPPDLGFGGILFVIDLTFQEIWIPGNPSVKSPQRGVYCRACPLFSILPDIAVQPLFTGQHETEDWTGSGPSHRNHLPHLSYLPMNEALSAEEWDPYLPFGIVHVVTNKKQMSRQVVFCTDCVEGWLCACISECMCVCVFPAQMRFTPGLETWLGLKTQFMKKSEQPDVKQTFQSVLHYFTTWKKTTQCLCICLIKTRKQRAE